MTPRTQTGFVVPLKEALDEARVGGKARNLARLINA